MNFSVSKVLLKRKTFSGFKWQVTLQGVTRTLSVVTLALLARLVEPSVFGLFALAFTALEGLSLFKTFGLDSGVIQRSVLNPRTLATAFWLTFFSGLAIASACVFLAPSAGTFFRSPEAEIVLRLLGAAFFVTALGKIPSALLTRAMRFREIAAIQLWGAVVNTLCVIGFVLYSPTVVSLMAAYLLKTCVMSFLVWHLSGFRPAFSFDRRVVSGFVKFGSVFALGSALAHISENVSTLTAGRMLGASFAGSLTLAGAVTGFLYVYLTGGLLRVLFPAYASLQKEAFEFKRVYLKSFKFLALIALPFCLMVSILAPELVNALYGEKWGALVPLVRLGAFCQLFTCFTIAAWPVYVAAARPRYVLFLAFVSLCLKLPLVILFTRLWGLEGTLAAELALSAFVLMISLRLVQKIVPITVREIKEALRPAGIASAWMAAALIIFKISLMVPGEVTYPLIPVMTLAGFGAIVYGMAVRFIDFPAVGEIGDVLRRTKSSSANIKDE